MSQRSNLEHKFMVVCKYCGYELIDPNKKSNQKYIHGKCTCCGRLYPKQNKKEFKATPHIPFVSCHLLQHITIIPKELNDKFAHLDCNANCEDGKVDRQFIFTKGHLVFKIWAFKATNLYEDDLPDPNTFWNSTNPYMVSLAGINSKGLNEFLKWLKYHIIVR